VKIQIKNLLGVVLFEGEYGSVVRAVETASLRWANLSHADLTGASLSYADLTEANLSHADLTGASLSYAALTGANISYADLTGANLSHADLTGANLSYADLTEASLSVADITGANLWRAKGIIAFGPVPTSGRMGYVVKHEKCVMVQLGCWWGTLAETLKRIAEVHPNAKGKAYAGLVRASARSLKVTP